MQKSHSLSLIALLSAALLFSYGLKAEPRRSPAPRPGPAPIFEPRLDEPRPQGITLKVPHHLTYPQIVEQMKKWRDEAPDLVELSVYGQTRAGTDLWCMKVSNRKAKAQKAPVLLMSCIHGNETLATGVLMGFVGSYLGDYGRDETVNELMDSRELYFVPVVSPDSYGKSRNVDGVDPNRDFPTPDDSLHQSSPSVMALRRLFMTVRPRAALSGHTYGRLFLTPFGDKRGPNQHQPEYDRIVGEMARMSKYGVMHCSELYGRPISGTEVDFFYRNGCLAAVAEFGTHQHIPSYAEITGELERTRDAITLFIKQAPEVSISLASEEIDFSKNTGIAQSPPRNP